jgi:taurine dioxygenase
MTPSNDTTERGVHDADRAIALERLTPFGARIDLDLRTPPTPGEATVLRGLLARHELLVVAGQHVTEAQMVDFARCFGNVLAGGYIESGDVTHVSNTREDGLLGDTRLVYHSDFAFGPSPLQAICLHAMDVRDTKTYFASGRGAYERLAPDVRARVEHLDARHEHDLTAAIADPEVMGARVVRREGRLERWADHPLVVGGTHPSLYLSYQHMTEIVGLDPDESDELLDVLFAAAFAPDNVYTHHWMVGDVVVWDNRAVQHARDQLVPGVPRTLRRITISDRPPLEPRGTSILRPSTGAS